jgi:hypothetical protein
MTYKSTKFHQSPVARSLEQLAIQKGLFKAQEAQKAQSEEEKAPVKTASAPKSFPEKLLALCDGLRAGGFAVYANTLETQFLLMKKAESNLRAGLVKQADNQLHLYNTHGEEGKDIIEFAHPDKNKKLDKSWDDLGVIENIVEKHEKILDVVNKQPRGKLSSKNIANAVKIVLSQGAAHPDYSGKIKELVAEGLNYANAAVAELQRTSDEEERTKGNRLVRQSTLDDIRENLAEAKTMADGNLDYKNIMEITRTVDGIPGDLSDENFFMTSDGEQLMDHLKSILETAKSRFNAAFQLLKGEVQGAQFQLEQGVEPSKISLTSSTSPDAEKPSKTTSDFKEYADHYLNTLEQWKATVSNDAENTPEDKQKANAYLDAKAQQLTSLLQQFETAPAGSAPAFTKQLHDLAASLNQFHKEWIGS